MSWNHGTRLISSSAIRTRRGKLDSSLVRYSVKNPGKVIRSSRFYERYIEGTKELTGRPGVGNK